MKNLFIALFLYVVVVNSYAATCTTYSRTNYTTNQVLTSSSLNSDFNNLVTRTNAFDGGCVSDGTLEIEAVSSSEWGAMLKGIQLGCKTSYSDTNTLSVGKCISSVNGSFVETTAANTVTWGCGSCSAEATGTTYYLYAKNGSASTTLNLLISSTGPNEDGYDNSSNKVLSRFYNNTTGYIDQYSIDQWAINKFSPQTMDVVNAGTMTISATTTAPTKATTREI